MCRRVAGFARTRELPRVLVAPACSVPTLPLVAAAPLGGAEPCDDFCSTKNLACELDWQREASGDADTDIDQVRDLSGCFNIMHQG